jgi:cytochrome c-type biogenesis protein
VLSVNEATAGRGALLSAVFALGLGLPFIAAAFAYRRMLGAFGVIRRHQLLVVRLGGVMMILVGVLLVTGWWDRIVQWLQLQVVQGFTVPV